MAGDTGRHRQVFLDQGCRHLQGLSGIGETFTARGVVWKILAPFDVQAGQVVERVIEFDIGQSAQGDVAGVAGLGQRRRFQGRIDPIDCGLPLTIGRLLGELRRRHLLAQDGASDLPPLFGFGHHRGNIFEFAQIKIAFRLGSGMAFNAMGLNKWLDLLDSFTGDGEPRHTRPKTTWPAARTILRHVSAGTTGESLRMERSYGP